MISAKQRIHLKNFFLQIPTVPVFGLGFERWMKCDRSEGRGVPAEDLVVESKLLALHCAAATGLNVKG